MITQKELKSLLHYDPVSGVFIWLNCKNKMHNGKITRHVGSNGYGRIVIRKQVYRTGRLAFLYMEGYFPEYEVDHIDRDRANDKWENLRHVTSKCNHRNCGIRSDNTTGVKGVGRDKNRGKWIAGIKNDGKTKNLGRFTNFDEAVCHRLAAEQCLDWSYCDSSSSAFQHVKKILSG